MKGKEESNFWDKDFGGAILLVFIGILFLLITTGQLNWNIWLHIFKFWPLLVISWGISLILEGLHIKKFFISLISLAILLTMGILGYRSYTQESSFSFNNFFNQFKTENSQDITDGHIEESLVISKEDYSDIKERSIDINIAATEVNVTDSEQDEYIRINSEYNANVIKPVLESDSSEGNLSITFKILNQRRFNTWSNYSSKFNVFLGNPNIPTSINIKLGAGEGNINLAKQLLQTIDAKVGAGSLNINLSEISTPESMILDVGAGEMVLILPKETGFNMQYTLGLGEIQEGDEDIATFIGTGSSYKSSNYDTAKKIIQIECKVGVGRLQIEYN